jgi:peroxiredoxin
MTAARQTRLHPGDRIEPRRLATLDGRPVDLPDAGLVHLQFRRFAGCPVCDLHLRTFARRHDEIGAAGVRVLAVFHASAETLAPYVAELPFAIVPDPGKALYRTFGVEAGLRAILDPRAWRHIVRAIATSLRDRRPAPSLTPEGGRYGLPADFLVGPDGTLLASKYGEHVYDQWSVDDLLALAREHRRRPSAAAE